MNKKLLVFTLLFVLLSIGVLAEPIIVFELEIYGDDSIGEYLTRLTTGRPTSYHHRNGYNLTVVNDRGDIVFNQPVKIEIYWPAESDSFYYKIPYDTSMYELRFYHGKKLIFSKVLNFCNSDGVCDTTSETYESCPADCPLDHNDIICIAESDGACDPDCGEDVDPDCEGEFYPYAGPNEEVEVGSSLKFEGEIKNKGSGKYSYNWFFEDDGSTETGKKVSHKFKEEGVFAVDLTVTDQDGVYKDDTLLVTVTKKRIVKETKHFFTRIPTLILLAVALLGIILFYKKLKETGIKLRIGIVTLISILFILVVLLSFFFIGEEEEYYHENYCEKDSDCEGWGCEGCRSIFKGPKSEITAQAITGYSVCLSPICVCENNRCEVFNTENVSEEYCKRREDHTQKVKSYCYKDLAKKLNDISFCESVDVHDIKLQCKEELMGEDVTIEFCKLYNQEGFKNSCIIKIAKKLNDPNICNEFDGRSKENCLFYYVDYIISEENCEKLKYYKQDCYHKLAKKLHDVNFCDKVQHETTKRICISESAKSAEDCDKIEEKYPRWDCIIEHAKSAEDCDKIESDYSKKKCLEGIESMIGDE